MDTVIAFETHDSEKTVRLENIYVTQGYFTFMFQVWSGAFQGKSSFCVSHSQLQAFSEGLLKMNESLDVQAVLNDNDSDAFLTLASLNHGQLIVTGQVGGTHEDQFMEFRFETDQTILSPLQIQIGKLLKNSGLQE